MSSPASPSTAQPDAAALAERLSAVETQLTAVLEAVEALPGLLPGGSRPPAGYAELEERALTTAGVCDALSIGRTRLYELIAEGHLRPVKLGRELRFPATQVRALLRRGTSP